MRKKRKQTGGFIENMKKISKDYQNFKKWKKKNVKSPKYKHQKGGRKKRSQKGGILKYLQPWNVDAQDAEAKRIRKRRRKELKHRHPDLYKHLGRAFFTGEKIPKKYIETANYYGYETEFDGTPIFN